MIAESSLMRGADNQAQFREFAPVSSIRPEEPQNDSSANFGFREKT